MNESTPKRLRVVAAPSASSKVRRLIWSVVEATLYRWSPVPAHGWRRMLLRLFGARIGPGAHPYPSARVWDPANLEIAAGGCIGPRSVCYAVAPITIGERAVVSQGAHLCAATHDHNAPEFPLVVGEIRIDAGAWVAADAFVGPGVHIGRNAVAGARSVVVKDVPEGVIVAGNPAVRKGIRKV